MAFGDISYRYVSVWRNDTFIDLYDANKDIKESLVNGSSFIDKLFLKTRLDFNKKWDKILKNNFGE